MSNLRTAEEAFAAAKAAYASEPTHDNRQTMREAALTVREARWAARGGLDNPHGARSYADLLTAQREQRQTGREVTLTYEGDTVTVHYGEWLFAAPEGTGEGDA